MENVLIFTLDITTGSAVALLNGEGETYTPEQTLTLLNEATELVTELIKAKEED